MEGKRRSVLRCDDEGWSGRQDFADALASTGDRYAAWAAVNQAIKELTMVVERSKSANTVYYSKQALSTAQALREHIKGMP